MEGLAPDSNGAKIFRVVISKVGVDFAEASPMALGWLARKNIVVRRSDLGVGLYAPLLLTVVGVVD